MRVALGMFALGFAILAIAGCYHDKYHSKPDVKEEAVLPPHEKRYDEPDTAPYKKPPPPKDEKTLLGKTPGSFGGPGGGGPGGF
jgi:hypothetical protein